MELYEVNIQRNMRLKRLNIYLYKYIDNPDFRNNELGNCSQCLILALIFFNICCINLLLSDKHAFFMCSVYTPCINSVRACYVFKLLHLLHCKVVVKLKIWDFSNEAWKGSFLSRQFGSIESCLNVRLNYFT